MKNKEDTTHQTITNVSDIKLSKIYEPETTNFNIAFGLVRRNMEIIDLNQYPGLF